jgi:predicted O-methyltransferase YrrM
VMIFDQRVMSVDVVNAEPRRKYTASVQTFNEILLTDQRVEVSMLPVSDGVTMVRVRYI